MPEPTTPHSAFSRYMEESYEDEVGYADAIRDIARAAFFAGWVARGRRDSKMAPRSKKA